MTLQLKRLRRWAIEHASPLATGVAVLICLLGVFLRLSGWFDQQLGFWNDESVWVGKLAAGEDGQRPLAYAALARWIIAWRPTEFWLRSPSLLAGCLTLPALWALLRTAGCGRSVSLLGLLIGAVHPWGVAYSNEFKPYALELFVHVSVSWLALRYYQRPTWWRLATVALPTLAGPLFAWNAVFFLPGVLLAVALAQLRRRQHRQLAGLAGTALVGSGVLFWIYVTKLHGRTPRTTYWGEKYGVFFVGDSAWDHLRWLGEQTFAIARRPASTHVLGVAPEAWDAHATPWFALLVLCGLVVATRQRRWDVLLLGASPWLATAAVNVLGYWPYGAFRTNLFLLVYPTWLGCYGARSLAEWARRRSRSLRWTLTAVGLAWVVLLLPVDLAYFRQKDPRTSAPGSSTQLALQTIVREAPLRRGKARPPLVLDGQACKNFEYYSKWHPRHSVALRAAKLERRVVPRCLEYTAKAVRRAIASRQRSEFWLLTAKPSFAEWLPEHVEARCDVRLREVFPTGDVLIHCLPRTARPAAARRR